MSYQDPGFRPDPWEIIGDLQRRIAILEAARPGGSGILFDFDNQGGYLDVQTNAVDGGGRGIHLNDQSSGIGTVIEAEQGVTVQTDDARQKVIVDPNTGVTVVVQGGNPITLQTLPTPGAGGPINILVDAGGLFVQSDGGGMLFSEGGGGIVIKDTAGGAIVISTDTGTNGPISVQADGSLTLDGAPIIVGADVDASALPTSPGASGTLYVDGSGFVKRA